MKKRITYISILMLSIIPTFINATTTKVSCGNIKGVPIKILELSNLAINILEVTVPVLIIIFGIVDFVKAISSQKEDEMKKAQSTFIKRLIYGALVFFVFVIVKLFISFLNNVTNSNNSNIMKCVECAVVNKDKCK